MPFSLNIDTNMLSSEELQQFKDLVLDVFSVNEDFLGYTKTVTHKIPTVDQVPMKVPHRSFPLNRREEVRQHVEKLLRQKVIRPSTSPSLCGSSGLGKEI